jgi:uncharacterized protein YdeI (YjbR/CyaY-like superfamily)
VTTIDATTGQAVASAAEFEAWLEANGERAADVVVAIYNRRSGRQTVGLVQLQEIALCHGWVDTQTKRIDSEGYAIKFVRRRPRSNWSPKNRAMARRLLAEGRISPAGRATLPSDL